MVYWSFVLPSYIFINMYINFEKGESVFGTEKVWHQAIAN